MVRAAAIAAALLPLVAALIPLANNSEKIQLPSPSTTAQGSRHNCPHDQAGLLDWDEPAAWASGQVPGADGDGSLASNAHVLLSQTPTDSNGDPLVFG
jgi:hypothetical protein